MKEMFKEYHGILISIIGCAFSFTCLLGCFSMLGRQMNDFKLETATMEVVKEDNSDYGIKLEYPKSDYIRLIKEEAFVLTDYIVVLDDKYGQCRSYDYKLYQDGVHVDNFNTNVCGGYRLTADIYYRGSILKGNLLVIVEEG